MHTIVMYYVHNYLSESEISAHPNIVVLADHQFIHDLYIILSNLYFCAERPVLSLPEEYVCIEID